MPFPAFLSAPELDDPTWLQQLIETGAVTEILSGSSGEAQHVNSLSDKLMILSVVCKLLSFICCWNTSIVHVTKLRVSLCIQVTRFIHSNGGCVYEFVSITLINSSILCG